MTAETVNTLSDLDLPHCIETEQMMIGALLYGRNRMDDIAPILKPEHFFDPLHQRVYETMLRCYRSGKEVTIFSLRSEFEKDKAIMDLGGIAYLGQCIKQTLIEVVPSDIAKIVIEYAARRALIAAAEDIKAVAQDMPSEWGLPELMMMAEGKAQHVAMAFDGARKASVLTASNVSAKVVDQVLMGQATVSCRFGIRELDQMAGGMAPGEYIVIGGRPGMGKTAMGMQLALNIARQGQAVLFFSLEMTAAAITSRALTAIAYDNGHRLAYDTMRKGTFCVNTHGAALVEAQAELSQLPLFFIENAGHSPGRIEADAKRMRRQLDATGQKLGLIIVDHIQKVTPDREMKGNKTAETTEVSSSLQKLAHVLSCPVIALAQLNRGVEGREDKRPGLSDLRESGGIEQDADTVILLYREAYYLGKKEPNKWTEADKHNEWYAKWAECRFMLEAHIAKQRNGAEGVANLHFDAPSSRIGDL